MTNLTGFKYEDLQIGQAHETVHTITENDIQRFAEVSGDFNPLHMSDEFAAGTIFGKRIAHGALTASYISGILGNNLPCPGAIFVGLSMRCQRPVHNGHVGTVRAEVSEWDDRGSRATLQLECLVQGKRVSTGATATGSPRLAQ